MYHILIFNLCFFYVVILEVGYTGPHTPIWLCKTYIVHENSSILSPHPEKSDVQGFMIDSGPKLSPEHDRLSWTRFRFGQLSLIGANWMLISVFPNSLIF